MTFRTDPFRISIMGWSAGVRVLAVLVLLAALWAAIVWAVALP